MIKPWSIQTFPRERPVYVRPKQALGVGSLVVAVHISGVGVFYNKADGQCYMRTITWGELAASCVEWDGRPCGIET